MSIDSIMKEQDEYLLSLINKHEIDISKLDDKRNIQTKLSAIQLPEFPNIKTEDWKSISNIWPSIDYDLFPRWKISDVPIMIGIGVLGGLISYGLHDVFEGFHENWTDEIFGEGGHSGEVIDKVQGKKHRFKYGHDILNPFEVDWKNYFPEGTEAGLLTKICAWLRHLVQDTFSTEGSPLPGSSYFRDVIDMLTSGISKIPGVDKYQAYKIFFTIKARDTIGTAFVAGAMSLYIYGTEKGNEKKFFNYRYTSLSLGALVVALVTGVCMPVKKASYNHSAVLAMVPYIVALHKVNSRINEQLFIRKIIINNDMELLDGQNKLLDSLHLNLNSFDEKLNVIISDLERALSGSSIIWEDCIKNCTSLLSEQEAWLLKVESNIMKEVM